MHAPANQPKIDLTPVRRALISVSDKTGIVDFARALQTEFNVELISTGGTSKTLRDAGLIVIDVSDLTGFPEMMDGRVKTLHPIVHGGFLALRDNPAHLRAMTQHNIQPIDLIVVNLYPFEATVAKPNCTFEEAIENIDIGGPAMIRSASKNHRSIVVVTDVIQYEKVLKHMRRNKTADGLGQTPYKFRLDLAMWAYSKTAQYDAAIYPYLAEHYYKNDAEKPAEEAGLLPLLTPRLKKTENLRYGENPHQVAAFYTASPTEPGIATAKQLHGKPLSYINILDADAAIDLVREFAHPAAAVIKHTNPCGCAQADSLANAFDFAYAGDPVAAFGGIVALNREVDQQTAEAIVSGKRFLEVIIAPAYSAPALALLQDRWKDCRILATGPLPSRDPRALHFRSVTGGILVQQPDLSGFDKAVCAVTSMRTPTESEWSALGFVWLATKHVKSNAIAIAKSAVGNGIQLLAAGAGQMSRPMSAKIAIELAQKNGHAAALSGAVAGSDAFFPFPDAPELLINAGITAIIHPGGSKKDQDTIDLCNRHNIALVATGQRHFAH